MVAVAVPRRHLNLQKTKKNRENRQHQRNLGKKEGNGFIDLSNGAEISSCPKLGQIHHRSPKMKAAAIYSRV